MSYENYVNYQYNGKVKGRGWIYVVARKEVEHNIDSTLAVLSLFQYVL